MKPATTICGAAGCSNQVEQLRLGRRRHYCSDSCKYSARLANLATRWCVVCGDQYAPTYRRQRTCGHACSHRLRVCENPVPVTPRPCASCGKEHTRQSPSGGKVRRTCSDECAKIGKRARTVCPICGKSFEAVVNPPQKYCSPRCGWVAENARRGRGGHRTRHTGARRERYDDAYVFERDGWRCHICGRKIRKDLKWPHPWSASVDHLIPCGPRDLGPDTLDNVRASHLRCNESKGRRAANDQLMLVG